jgi:anti-anti-sigma factor
MADEPEERMILRLSGVVDYATVVEQRQRLIGLISSSASQKLVIDLGEIKVRGAVVIALLISLIRESRKIQKEVRFQNCPEHLRAVASACGVADILPLG